MVDEATNLIMEPLHILRRGQEALHAVVESTRIDVAELKVRMTGFEANLAQLQAQCAHLQAQVAIQSGRIDRMEQAMGRIEGSARQRRHEHLDRVEPGSTRSSEPA